MDLKAILDSIEGLPETIEIKREDLYVQKDGKYVLNVIPTAGYELDDVSGLKSALSKSRSLANENYEKLRLFDGLGDPEEIKKSLKKFEEIKDLDPEKKIAEATKAQIDEISRKFNAEKEDLTKKNELVTKQLENVLINDKARSALAEMGIEAIELALPHVTRNARMREKEPGNYVVEILDDQGNVRVGDVHGNPMTFTHLLDEMKEQKQFSPIFPGTGSSGSGTKGTKTSDQSDTQTKTPAKSVSVTDQVGMNQNLESIASGETVVTDL